MTDKTPQCGWVAIPRTLIKSPIYSDATALRLYLHITLTANYKDEQTASMSILAGQLITSVANLSEATNLTQKQVRNALQRLVEANIVALMTTNRYTLIDTDVERANKTASKRANKKSTKTQNESAIYEQSESAKRQAKRQTKRQQINKYYKEDIINNINKKKAAEEFFFLKNIKNYEQEAERFIAYNEAKGTIIDSEKKLNALLRLWKPQPSEALMQPKQMAYFKAIFAIVEDEAIKDYLRGAKVFITAEEISIKHDKAECLMPLFDSYFASEEKREQLLKINGGRKLYFVK